MPGGALYRRLLALALTTVLVVVLPGAVQGDWTRVTLANGSYACKDQATGVQFAPPQGTKSQANYACSTLTSFIPWLSTAAAAPLSIALGTNPNGQKDTGNPCLDGTTNCQPPSTVSWNTTTLASLMAVVTSRQTGTATDIDLSSACSGANCGSAVYQLHTAVTHWSIGGTGTKHLLNGGSFTGNSATDGALTLDVCYPTNATCNTSSPFNWAYIAAASDTTPPTAPQNLSCAQGSGQYTCTWSTSVDPSDGVAHSGVASYILKQGASTVATVTASNPGLNNDFSTASFGTCSGSPSATQGTGASGGRWTMVGCGYGFENAKDDNYQGEYAQVSGTTKCVSTKLTSLTATKTYNKAALDARNSVSSATAAHIAPYFLLTSGVYYIQYVLRSSDGGSQTTSSDIVLSGSPPFYGELCIINNLASFTYSSDGGTPSTAFANVALTLNNTAYLGVANSATDDGSNQANGTAVFDDVAVRNEYQLSTTVTSSTTSTCTILAKDTVPNTTTALGAVPCGPQAASGSAHKWAPGHYMIVRSGALYGGSNNDSARHSLYSIFLTDANVKGVQIWVDWQYLESEAGGDYTMVTNGGFNWLHNEINYIKTTYPGKYVSVMMWVDRYNSGGGGTSTQQATYPNYLVTAGCLFDQLPVSGKGAVGFHYDIPQCRTYLKNLLIAYGAEFDSEPALIAWRIDQETDEALAGAARETGLRDVYQAAATAFPTTNIYAPVNWTGVDTGAAKEALLLYLKSIHVGLGNPDTQLLGDFSFSVCPSSFINCVILGQNASIGGTNHNNCGEFVGISAIELSSLGYNSQGNITSQQAVNSANTEACAHYFFWDLNNSEIGSSDTQYWNGAHGQKWAIDGCSGACPFIHTTKPAGYP